MSFYKILQEIKEITRFQLIQKSKDLLELRIISEDKEIAFKKAKDALIEFLIRRGITEVDILMSNEKPSPNPISGKFNHVYKIG